MGQPTAAIPVYKVQTLVIDAEDDETTEVSNVYILPKVKAKRANINLASDSTQLGKVARKVSFLDQGSKVTNSRLLLIQKNKNQCNTSPPFSSVISKSEGSDDYEVFAYYFTSHRTANAVSETKSSFLSSQSLKPNQVHDISIPRSTPESITESQFSSSIPYLEGGDQAEVTKESAFIPLDNELQDAEIKEPHGLNKSTRSTRGQPPERYGDVYTFSALRLNAFDQPWYKQNTFIPCT